MSDHLPPEFHSWPRERKIDHIAMSHTRAGLIAEILSYADVDLQDRDIPRDKVLTTEELATIYLVIAGAI